MIPSRFDFLRFLGPDLIPDPAFFGWQTRAISYHHGSFPFPSAKILTNLRTLRTLPARWFPHRILNNLYLISEMLCKVYFKFTHFINTSSTSIQIHIRFLSGSPVCPFFPDFNATHRVDCQLFHG